MPTRFVSLMLIEKMALGQLLGYNPFYLKTSKSKLAYIRLNTPMTCPPRATCSGLTALLTARLFHRACFQQNYGRKEGQKGSIRVLLINNLTTVPKEYANRSMARSLRIQFDGARYHVINRGNYRGDLFESEGAAKSFWQTMREAVVRYGWLLHAYVIMRNHDPLAIETPKGNLVDGMRWLQSTAAARFNRFRGEHGHVFQGRYKALSEQLHMGKPDSLRSRLSQFRNEK